jgi:hypothetical protein
MKLAAILDYELYAEVGKKKKTQGTGSLAPWSGLSILIYVKEK